MPKRILVKNEAMQKTEKPLEDSNISEKLRLDKWLWVARFYKTRSLAVEEINKGRVFVNDASAKPAREVKAGDSVRFRQGHASPRTVQVLGISQHRGPAPVAQLLYQETAESLRLKAEAADQRQQGTEPAHTLLQGRPTKRDRRLTDRLQQRGGDALSGSAGTAATWGTRWSASVEPD